MGGERLRGWLGHCVSLHLDSIKLSSTTHRRQVQPPPLAARQGLDLLELPLPLKPEPLKQRLG
jgi:hypothetical protein